ncbi:hypothetical protein QBD01_001498 [Ochrobactrum sp. 19YEA23]|uniref:hypothetical protein n=1 Tax=Ochrobactrum sp. 19YEA23 TaxID=3039854 RepID=UPI002479759C|nr:hypothetical protein [Ochrobactrum sp. 19YEA23]
MSVPQLPSDGSPGDIHRQFVLYESMPEPLHLIGLSLMSVETARARYPAYRLTRLVASRLELDNEDIRQLSSVPGIDILPSSHDKLRSFDQHLRTIIARYNLDTLFQDSGHGPYHHSIQPTGYDFYHDEVMAVGMEQWRAGYRHMSKERQMLAASIIWLYRAGKDNVWLRRVPCSWHAADAIECMRAAGVLDDWLRLYLLYPGW